jgi:iron complex transport system substrate-binding protein
MAGVSMKIGRRSLLISLAALFLLGACSDRSSDLAGQTNQPTPTVPCRTVEHGMGKSCVPFQPQRVVVIGELDNVIALGVKPVGAITFDTGEFPKYLGDKTQGIQKVGTYSQPSLEKILLLKPDLIIGSTWNDAGLYNQLSRIAPTVFVETNDNLRWKDWFRKEAETLGKTQEAEQLIQQYEQRVQRFRQAMGDRLPTTKISVVNFWQDNVRIYMKRSFSGQILQEVGLPRPAAQDKDKIWERVSLELIPSMDGDAIFLLLGDHNVSKLKQFQQHPLWSKLQPVKAQKVYEVDGYLWIAGWSITSANLILDDLFQHLVEQQPS